MTTSVSSNKPAVKVKDCLVKSKGLEKIYRNGTKALESVDLEVFEGELFGLIGPDGAGKTTTLKILAGVLEPSKGEVSVVNVRPRDARHSISYLTQHFSLYSDLTIYENLEYEAGLRGIPRDVFIERAEKYLKDLGLFQFSDRLAGKLSGGMKQKLSLCCCLLSKPRVLLLDEPSAGLDPLSRRELWQHLFSVTREGMTTIVATPYMDEAELCSRVALIQEGSIHEVGSPRELKDALGLKRLDVTIAEVDDAKKALEETKNRNNIVDVYAFGDKVDVIAKDAEQAEIEVRDRLKSQNLNPSAIEITAPTLDDVFSFRLRERGVQETIPPPLPRLNQAKSEKQNKNDQDAVSADGLRKTYQKFEAVKKLDLKVRYGEIYGLLGANGAGKTTTIKMLCGLENPTSGTVTIGGEKGNLRSHSLRKRLGYMSQKFTLYDALTVIENLKFYASIYEIPYDKRKEKIDWALDACGLKGKEKEIVGRLPRGWKQRIAFGASVMHEPEILFLDEPTAGVDPIARRQIWSMIRELTRSGTAIIVTTHYLDEAEYCNALGFMADGTMVAQGSPSEIKQSQTGKVLEIVTDNPREASSALASIYEGWQVSVFRDVVHLCVDNPEGETSKVRNKLRESGVKMDSIHMVSASLEDAFVSIVSKIKNGGKSDANDLRTSS
jgi:ABC-2 type transport system ATP-binding protein